MKKRSRVTPRLAAIALATACTATILGTTSPAFASRPAYTEDELGDLMDETAEITGISRTSSGIEIAGTAGDLHGGPFDFRVTVDGGHATWLSTSRLAPGISRDGRFNITVNTTPGTHTVCMTNVHGLPFECATINVDNEVGTLKDVSWAYVNYRFDGSFGTRLVGLYVPGDVHRLRMHGTLVDAQRNPRGGGDLRITVNGTTVPHEPYHYAPKSGQTQSDSFDATVLATHLSPNKLFPNKVCAYMMPTNNLIGCKTFQGEPNTH